MRTYTEKFEDLKKFIDDEVSTGKNADMFYINILHQDNENRSYIYFNFDNCASYKVLKRKTFNIFRSSGLITFYTGTGIGIIILNEKDVNRFKSHANCLNGKKLRRTMFNNFNRFM